MTEGLPVDILEKKAEEERGVLEARVTELRKRVKDRLDVKKNVREHVWTLSGLAVLVGLSLGFALTGLFTRR